VRRVATLFVLLAFVATAVALARRAPPRPPPPSPESAAERPLPEGEWLGSDGCANCHGEIHERWAKTNHARTIRPFSQAIVPKDFSGEVWTSRGIDHVIGPGPSMEVEGPGGEMRRFPVEWVIGVRRVQMFTTTLEGGRIQVLPVFLEVPARKWFDYTDFVFGRPKDFVVEPDSANSWYVFGRNFNSRCGECHMTGYEVGYDADRGAYATRYRERVVGCESCHGPAAAHARHWMRKEGGKDPIVNPSRLPVQRANQVCGYCHAEREEVVPGFRPGDDLFAFCDVNGLEDSKHLYPDGRARELIHNLVPVTESRCAPVRCTECHDPHGRVAPGDLRRPLEDDETCLRCHEHIRGAIEAHTRHPAASSGSRCVNCHMPPLVIEGGHGRVRDHTISIPSPRNRRAHGVPDACSTCHLTEAPGWDAEQFARLWPGAEERNHRTRLADAVALGRAGDPRAREPLLELARDPNPVYRAGACWMLARMDVDLASWLDDSHAMVRRAAIRGAAARDPDRVAALLSDANMVVRRAAAQELSDPRHFDLLRARPDLVERLVAVLGPFVELRPDAAWFHFALGALHELRSDPQAAARSYERYLRIQPWDARIRAHAETLARRRR
jgi:predicted CXXCH cytochrome family protein